MSALEEAAVNTLVIRYYALVSFAILYYDYLLTLQIEFERYWHFKPFRWHWGVALFFFVRYVGVYGHIPVLISAFVTAHDVPIYAVVIQFSVGGLLIIRTYAMYDRNKWVLRVTTGFALLGTAVGCWGVLAKHDSAPTEPPIVGCNSSLSDLQGQRLAIAWGGVLVFDCLIFSLTLYKAFTVRRVGRRTLFDILIRDGAVYFGCMTIANLSNIVTFVLGQPLIKGVSTIFTNVLAVTLMSRLMLNIRDPKYLREQRDAWSSQTRPSTTLATSVPFISTVYPSTGASYVSDATYRETIDDHDVELAGVQVTR